MKVIYTEDSQALKVSLDLRDKKILAYLCANARYPLREIGRNVKLSRNSVDYRIKQMQKNHILAGTRTVVNISKLGYASYHFFLTIQEDKAEKKLLERCMQHDAVNALISYSGKWNLEVSIMASSPHSASRIFEELTQDVKLHDSSVCILLSTIKGIVVPHELLHDVSFGKIQNDKSFVRQFQLAPIEYDVDATDLKLMKLLSDDAMLSLRELGHEVELTYEAVKQRVNKMIRSQHIIQFRPVVNYSEMGYHIETVLLWVQKNNVEQKKRIERFIRNHPNVLWCAEVLADWSYVIYLIHKNSEEIHDFIRLFKKDVPDCAVEYEILFAYKEYKYSFMSKSIVKELEKRKEKI